MIRSFRLKLMIIILSVLALFVTATAFSVSYAKWVKEDTVSASGTIGTWSISSDTQYGSVRFEPAEGSSVKIKDGDQWTNPNEGDFYLTVDLTAGSSFTIYVKGKQLTLNPSGDGASYLIKQSDGSYKFNSEYDAALRFEYNSYLQVLNVVPIQFYY